MDETLFRQLLSRHVGTLLDPRTLQKGADYMRRGRVRETRYVAGDREGALIGTVQGSARHPYAAGIHIGLHGERVRLDSHCTCPLQFACKHVAATALQALRAQARPAESPAVAVQLGAWKNWLDTLQSPAPPAPGAAADRTETVCGILLSGSGAAVPSVHAQAVRMKHGKRGGYISPQPLTPTLHDPAPWAGLGGDAFRLVAQLRMRSPAADGNEGFELRGAADEVLLEELLAELPCFFGKPSAGRLRLGARRALRIGWDARDDGTQKLALSVDAASPQTRLLRVGGLWYCDPATREIGRVDGEPRLAEAVLRAPPLLPEQVPLLLERWKDAPLLAALPTPPAALQVERCEVTPVPVLTLRTLSVVGYGGARYQAALVRLGFDYAGVRLPVFPAAARERRRLADRVIEIVRDRASEVAACERLDGIGLVPAELFGRLSGVARDAVDDNDFVLEHGRGQLAGADQLFALAPRLRDLGFRLESADGFPFDLLDEPAADAWYAEVEEEPGNPWFDLRLGIDLGGERIDLLPVLHKLLSDPAFPLAARKGEAADAVWLVPIDARRRVPLPLAKLRELVAPLLEWLQGAFVERDGALRLRRAQAGVVEELAQGMQRPWQGGERLRAELERWRAPRAPAQEPPGFGATLRGYQRDGLAWLGFLADAGLGGILADDMGLGKTVQVLAHVLAEKQRGRLDRPALVIAPTSLVGNWHDEAARFTPDLSVLVVHGPERAAPARRDSAPRPGHHDLPAAAARPRRAARTRVLGAGARRGAGDQERQEPGRPGRARAGGASARRDDRHAAGKPSRRVVGAVRLRSNRACSATTAASPASSAPRSRSTPTSTSANACSGASRRCCCADARRTCSPSCRRRPRSCAASNSPATSASSTKPCVWPSTRACSTRSAKRGLAQSGIIVLDALLKLRQACCDPRLVKLRRRPAHQAVGQARLPARPARQPGRRGPPRARVLASSPRCSR